MRRSKSFKVTELLFKIAQKGLFFCNQWLPFWFLANPQCKTEAENTYDQPVSIMTLSSQRGTVCRLHPETKPRIWWTESAKERKWDSVFTERIETANREAAWLWSHICPPSALVIGPPDLRDCPLSSGLKPAFSLHGHNVIKGCH